MRKAAWWTVTVLVCLCGVPLLAEEPAPPPPMALTPEAMPLHQLRDEITAYNLINGLDLTADQLQVIASACREWGQVQERAAAQMVAIEEQYADTMEQLRDVLSRGEQIPPNVEQPTHQMSGRQSGLIYEISVKSRHIAGKVLACLNDNQKALLDEYRPCLVPPKTRDTSSIGAPVGDTSAITARLEDLRNIPAPVWQREHDRIVGQMVQRIQVHLRDELTPEEIQSLNDTLSLARSLGEVEFKAQKEDLARRLMLRENPDEEVARHEKRRLERIAQFLLKPGIAEPLEQRVLAMREAPQAEGETTASAAPPLAR